MPADVKQLFLADLYQRFPASKKMPRSQSLYDLGPGLGRVYIRYSKLHPGGRTFYGLRKIDLHELEGHTSTICFLWDEQTEPLLVPFADFEDVFQIIAPADDGQYKAQIYVGGESTELYIACAGRFNVDGYFGWSEHVVHPSADAIAFARQMTHSQVQTLLGSIGNRKGHNIWIPPIDRGRMDWTLSSPFPRGACFELQRPGISYFEMRSTESGMELKDRFDIEIPGHPYKIRGNYKQVDFAKDSILCEVQFGKYFSMFYDLAKFQYFFNELSCEVGVEIVPAHRLKTQMSTGVAYGEQLIFDIGRLRRHFPAVPVKVILIDVEPRPEGVVIVEAGEDESLATQTDELQTDRKKASEQKRRRAK